MHFFIFQDGVLNLVSGSADGQLITWRDITESAALLKQVGHFVLAPS